MPEAVFQNWGLGPSIVGWFLDCMLYSYAHVVLTYWWGGFNGVIKVRYSMGLVPIWRPPIILATLSIFPRQLTHNFNFTRRSKTKQRHQNPRQQTKSTLPSRRSSGFWHAHLSRSYTLNATKMEDLLLRVGAQAANFAIRSGVGYASKFAFGQVSKFIQVCAGKGQTNC
jgi:hypothetical protein